MLDRPKHIAIVGAGLVGSLLAIYLAKRGYRVSVYERRDDSRHGVVEAGRSINLALSNRGLRALRELGLTEAVKAITIPMHGRIIHDASANITMIPYGKQGEFINSIPRTALNILLIVEAERYGVTFYFNHKIVSVDIAKTRLVVQRPAPSDTGILAHSFDYIIGADGAYSVVRSAFQTTDRFNFSQRYIEHGYKEFAIPAGQEAAYKLEQNGLHIWPRESFMMIALPNPGGSFTATLFYPVEGKASFDSLRSDNDIRNFFTATFPDFVGIAPDYLRDYRHNPASSLISVECWPWVKNNTLLIGDAVHAIVPFYGQGMNAGFEDCRILNQLLQEHNDDWTIVSDAFQRSRKPDTDTIAQMALDNFVEMRDLVADDDFKLRKKIEARLHAMFPEKWIPLYSMVTFHDEIRYSDAHAIGLRQKAVMDQVMNTPSVRERWDALDFESIVKQLSLPT